MKVILLQDIKGIGRKGEIKTVSDGHAKNLLIPKGLVKVATDGAVHALNKTQEAKQKEQQALEAELREVAKKIPTMPFKFGVKAGKHGEVFGSVAKHDIEEKVREQIAPAMRDKAVIKVELEKPLKAIGTHEVEINFGHDITTNISVTLEPNE